MKSLLSWLFNHFLFAGTMFFAAGAVAVDPGADPGATVDTGADAGAVYDEGDTAEVVDDAGAGDEAGQGDDQARAAKAQQDEPDVAEFTGMVSGKIRNMVKAAPELGAVFQKHPEIKNEIEARFRREAAFREIYPTVAEARQMREHFPNGLSDVQQLLTDVQEVEALDRDFYSRDNEGNYTGHGKLLNNMFTDDREATVALFRTLPKEWHRLDPDSYNEVFGGIVGATLSRREIPEYMTELAELAKDPKNIAQVEAGLRKLQAWAESYTEKKGRPSPEEERLSTDRQRFKRETADRDREDGQKFHQSFVSESVKLQREIISKHPAIQRLEKVSSITPAKRTEIIDKVREKVKALLGKSPSFMRKLNPAHKSRNLQETLTLQRAAWSQPWLLNKMVREVLKVETPAMVQGNRDAAQRRAGGVVRTPAKTGTLQQKPTPKGPRQVGGRWYKEDGSPFTTAEVIQGKHLQQ